MFVNLWFLEPAPWFTHVPEMCSRNGADGLRSLPEEMAALAAFSENSFQGTEVESHILCLRDGEQVSIHISMHLHSLLWLMN